MPYQPEKATASDVIERQVTVSHDHQAFAETLPFFASHEKLALLSLLNKQNSFVPESSLIPHVITYNEMDENGLDTAKTQMSMLLHQFPPFFLTQKPSASGENDMDIALTEGEGRILATLAHNALDYFHLAPQHITPEILGNETSPEPQQEIYHNSLLLLRLAQYPTCPPKELLTLTDESKEKIVINRIKRFQELGLIHKNKPDLSVPWLTEDGYHFIQEVLLPIAHITGFPHIENIQATIDHRDAVEMTRVRRSHNINSETTENRLKIPDVLLDVITAKLSEKSEANISHDYPYNLSLTNFENFLHQFMDNPEKFTTTLPVDIYPSILIENPQETLGKTIITRSSTAIYFIYEPHVEGNTMIPPVAMKLELRSDNRELSIVTGIARQPFDYTNFTKDGDKSTYRLLEKEGFQLRT